MRQKPLPASSAPADDHDGRAAAPLLTLEDRIRACYQSLPGSEVVVADVLLHHPGRLATHSATELAAAAKASKAAVTRLIQRLGFASYAEARSEAREAQQWGSPVYLEAKAPVEVGARAAFARHVAADQQILAQSLGALTNGDLEAAIEVLASARRVVVIGFRNSAWLAMYAHSQFGLLRPGIELAPLPAETLAEAMVGLGADDLVFAVGFRRRVPAFAAALRAAHSARARIVLVTDPSGAADLRFADWTLSCHCRSASMFDSYVAAVSLLNFLAAQLAQALGESGRRRLQEVERWHGSLGDLA
ncbi:MurR/RpiR family transcriptional regulator [Piscinibacter sakaiensis]|uniref:MurR/RpiR family transcriptional regulator n=1 Tax=Piscinibacter sakaiensis TaxID=1547922 RepID=UPI003AAD8824